MTTETEPGNPAKLIVFGWSVEPNAKRYHKLGDNSSSHYSACRQWNIDVTSTSRDLVPSNLTPCPRCFPSNP